MPLTNTAIRNAKPESKPYKMSDGGGLFLLVQPDGHKWWRYKYRFAGKEKLLALGTFPETSLAEARDLHAQARRTLKSGIDPSEAKREAKRQVKLKAANTFETVALEWYELHKHEWSSHYSTDVINRLKTHLFPPLRHRPIANLTAIDMLDVLRVIEKSGALDMTQRMLQTSAQIFRYAVTAGHVERNPVADLKGALKTPVRKHNSYLTAAQLPEYLQKLNAYETLQTKIALKLLLLTFVRTTELRGARWEELNLDKAEWRIPAERMKMKDPHIVPLSSQAVALFKEMQRISGNREHVFPNEINANKCMSNNTMLFALYRMGYRSRTTGHGFRACASTILNEQGFQPDVIERQLAHSERNGVRAAYNHAQYLPERRKMMQWWADYIESLEE
ncbi:MAG TPA: integrase arm-type DNA-binding domain-containing protein [Verrucomicrobiae bacterium]|nr:integrase arm-type DNA-binding domain-containing protein [Verrucomicrobiae bacterium]